MSQFELSSGRTLARNTVINIVGQAIPFLVGLITIPLIQKSYHMDRFGLLSMIWFVIGFFTFSDLGLGRAIIKLVAERIGNQLEDEIPKIVWTSLVVMFLMSALASLSLSFLARWITTEVLHVPLGLQQECVDSMHILSLTVIPVVLTAGVRGVVEAKQDFYFINVLHAITGSMTYISPLLIIPFSKSVFWIVLILSLVRWVGFFAHLFFCIRYYPALMRPIEFSREWLPRLVRFGGWVTLSNLLISLKVYMDRFFLGALVPIAQIPYYTTPLEILSRVLLVPGTIVRVLFPAFAARRSVSPETVGNLFIRGLKTVAVVLFVLVWALIYWGDVGLKFWLGEDFSRHATDVLRILSMGIFFNGISWIPFTYLQSAERADITAKTHIYEILFYSGVLWVGSRHFGLMGAAVARMTVEAFDLSLLLYFVKPLLPETKDGQIAFSALKRIFFCGLFVLLPGFAGIEVAARLPLSLISLGIFLSYFGIRILDLEDRVYLNRAFQKNNEDETSPEARLPQAIEKVCTIIVTYNPDRGLLERIQEHMKLFDYVLVVDNGSVGNAREELEEICKIPQVKVLFNDQNLGVAEALNKGVSYARQQGFEWVATFDQDSIVPRDFLRKMRLAYRRATKYGQVGILAPAHRDRDSGVILVPRFQDGEQFQFVNLTITSGNLIPLATFKRVGNYDQQLFIDYVDHDFCLRVIERGLRIVEVQDVHLIHNLGSPKWHRLGPWTFMVTHHSTLRRYYITRNRFLMYLRYWWLDPGWMFQDFGRFVKETLKILVYEQEKLRKIRITLRGIGDAILGKTGPKLEKLLS